MAHSRGAHDRDAWPSPSPTTSPVESGRSPEPLYCSESTENSRVPQSPASGEESEYANIDEIAAPPPTENPHEQTWYRHRSIEDRRSQERERRKSHQSNLSGPEEREKGFQSTYGGLDEVVGPPPEENLEEDPWRRRHSIEQIRSEQEEVEDKPPSTFSRLRAMNITNISYLIFFSIMGTLARLGLQALLVYPNSPVIMSEIWANVGGSFALGFLQEDKAIFTERRRSTPPPLTQPSSQEIESSDNENTARRDQGDEEKAQQPASQPPAKKTLPPYIGLTVGFCGSFTSFSSLVRDAFLALSNDLVAASPGSSSSRNRGYSAAAVTSVLITESALSLAALSAGAHLAIAMSPALLRFPNTGFRKALNTIIPLLGPGCWIGAVLLTIWPVHQVWRGEVLFALVFAPIGCLLRFALALLLNSVSDKFPLGTFAANVFGTVILGMCFTLQRSSTGAAIVSCQILQGIMDGFSGCLTTVSTWVAELKGLRRRHAYVYGFASIGVSFVTLVVIIGSLRWSVGFQPVMCRI